MLEQVMHLLDIIWLITIKFIHVSDIAPRRQRNGPVLLLAGAGSHVCSVLRRNRTEDGKGSRAAG